VEWEREREERGEKKEDERGGRERQREEGRTSSNQRNEDLRARKLVLESVVDLYNQPVERPDQLTNRTLANNRKQSSEPLVALTETASSFAIPASFFVNF